MLLAVGCLASCGGAFGDAPGSSGSGSSDGGASDQTNGGTGSDGGGHATLDGGVVDPGVTFSFVQADGPVQQVVQEQTAIIPITITRYITPGTDIKIDIINPPDGISSVGSLTIAPGQSTGTLAIIARPLVVAPAMGNGVFAESVGRTFRRAAHSWGSYGVQLSLRLEPPVALAP
ncbi:MAG: hypothetical protein FWD73_14395 [Polyangiaceae bacterium]|nr:hypothetical protein [Polyangiaceae bacterium]